MMKTVLFAAAAALATAATAAPVLANESTAKRVVVSYADLDLATAKGQKVFAQRIDRAAKNACGYQGDGRIKPASAIECYDKARAAARTQMATIVDDARLGG